MPSLLTKFSEETAEDAEQQIENTTLFRVAQTKLQELQSIFVLNAMEKRRSCLAFAVEDCLDFFRQVFDPNAIVNHLFMIHYGIRIHCCCCAT